MTEIPERVRAYAAGFFDGEGCICLHGSRQHNSLVVTIHMVQVDPMPLEIIQSHYGGRLTIKARSLSIRKEWRAVHKLQFCAVEGAKFIRSILPYLIVKREQAELLLMWLNLPWRARRVEESTGARLVRVGAPTPAQREIDLKFMQAIKDCKHEAKHRMAA